MIGGRSVITPVKDKRAVIDADDDPLTLCVRE